MSAASSNPITQTVLASPAGPEVYGVYGRPPPPRSFLLSLCQRACCGRGSLEAAEGEVAPLASSRPIYVPPAPHTGRPFLPPLQERDRAKKTLVLDLDETLVHSSFKSVANPDYVIPVEIDGKARLAGPEREPQPQLTSAAATLPDNGRLRSQAPLRGPVPGACRLERPQPGRSGHPAVAGSTHPAHRAAPPAGGRGRSL